MRVDAAVEAVGVARDGVEEMRRARMRDGEDAWGSLVRSAMTASAVSESVSSSDEDAIE